jgi:K+-sensing histidine kinase KdpD
VCPGALYLLVVYLLVIMPVAIVWGIGLAAVTAVGSAAIFAYLFVPRQRARDSNWRRT